MRRVAEIIYIVEEERKAFLEGAIHPDLEEQKVLWLCGVRKQQYFALNDLIFMTFEYEGKDFATDMSKMSAYLDSKGHLVKQRRRDVPESMRDKTNWWAPVKKLGSILDKSPIEEEDTYVMDMIDGYMNNDEAYRNLSYDEDDWSEGFHF